MKAIDAKKAGAIVTAPQTFKSDREIASSPFEQILASMTGLSEHPKNTVRGKQVGAPQMLHQKSDESLRSSDEASSVTAFNELPPQLHSSVVTEHPLKPNAVPVAKIDRGDNVEQTVPSTDTLFGHTNERRIGSVAKYIDGRLPDLLSLDEAGDDTVLSAENAATEKPVSLATTRRDTTNETRAPQPAINKSRPFNNQASSVTAFNALPPERRNSIVTEYPLKPDAVPVAPIDRYSEVKRPIPSTHTLFEQTVERSVGSVAKYIDGPMPDVAPVDKAVDDADLVAVNAATAKPVLVASMHGDSTNETRAPQQVSGKLVPFNDDAALVTIALDEEHRLPAQQASPPLPPMEIRSRVDESKTVVKPNYNLLGHVAERTDSSLAEHGENLLPDLVSLDEADDGAVLGTVNAATAKPAPLATIRHDSTNENRSPQQEAGQSLPFSNDAALVTIALEEERRLPAHQGLPARTPMEIQARVGESKAAVKPNYNELGLLAERTNSSIDENDKRPLPVTRRVQPTVGAIIQSVPKSEGVPSASKVEVVDIPTDKDDAAKLAVNASPAEVPAVARNDLFHQAIPRRRIEPATFAEPFPVESTSDQPARSPPRGGDVTVPKIKNEAPSSGQPPNPRTSHSATKFDAAVTESTDQSRHKDESTRDTSPERSNSKRNRSPIEIAKGEVDATLVQPHLRSPNTAIAPTTALLREGAPNEAPKQSDLTVSTHDARPKTPGAVELSSAAGETRRSVADRPFEIEPPVATPLPSSQPPVAADTNVTPSFIAPDAPRIDASPAAILPPELMPLAAQIADDASLRVTLNPNNARVAIDAGVEGRMSIQLTVQDGVTDIRATGPAAHMLEQRQGDLRLALAHEGLTLGNFDLTQSGSQHQSPHSPSRDESTAPRAQPARRRPEEADTNEAGHVHIKA